MPARTASPAAGLPAGHAAPGGGLGLSPRVRGRTSACHRWYAHRIEEPILLIHGEADNNSGTFPIQSERMFAAIKGNGGTVRLVMLPNESHGYAAEESVKHALYEMISWFDRHVKNAPPRTPSTDD